MIIYSNISLNRQFGELKSIRLPTKPGGKGHRGFAFVEYVSKDDAMYEIMIYIFKISTFLTIYFRNAMEALGNTRLYGRRFVMEFAIDDSLEGQSDQQ